MLLCRVLLAALSTRRAEVPLARELRRAVSALDAGTLARWLDPPASDLRDRELRALLEHALDDAAHDLQSVDDEEAVPEWGQSRS